MILMMILIFEVISCRGLGCRESGIWRTREHISCFERTVNWEHSATGESVDCLSHDFHIEVAELGSASRSVPFSCFWIHLKRTCCSILPAYITILDHLGMLNLICRSAFITLLQIFQFISWFWGVVIRSTLFKCSLHSWKDSCLLSLLPAFLCKICLLR